MITQRDELLRLLGDHGWNVVAIDEEPSEWWADTVVTLDSTWAPVNARLFLVFLVDPQHDGPRRPREHVWAVVASHERPHDLVAVRGLPTLPLHGWESGLARFLASANDLRAPTVA